MKRIDSIDIMRGLTLFLMLFVNDLFVPGVPPWMVHTAADYDGMGLADWVFPGFLFMVGLSIPFALTARKKKGHKDRQILIHILIRSLSLILIGVLMVNVGRFNAELSGMNKYLWTILLYISFFLVWNHYPDKRPLFIILRMAGVLLLITLSVIFRAGSPEEVSWLQTSWWGILGLIGWGYLVLASLYLLAGDRLVVSSMIFILFLIMNMLSSWGLLHFPNLIQSVFGVVLDGNVPLIVSGGLLSGILLKKYQGNTRKLMWIFLIGATLLVGTGFVLRNWFIISKIQGTPSWAMICNGISIGVFGLIWYLADILQRKKWAIPFFPAGRNSLTTYLAPDILYYLIWASSLPVLFYKQEDHLILAVVGSLVWAFSMIALAHLLSRIHIRLKL